MSTRQRAVAPDADGPGEDEPGEDAAREALAGNVRRLRLSRGMSLRDLAEATGSSKALLSQIERAVANPTIGVLTRVADALGVTLHELVRSPLLAPQRVTGDWADLDDLDDVALRTLFTSFERRRLEISEAALPTGHASSKSSHGRGSVEYAYVLDGAVTVTSRDWAIELGRGDGLRFSAEYDHVYTGGPAGARVLTVVAFADD
ncbi:cupin domain-containing protein [Nocardioides hungaricus]